MSTARIARLTAFWSLLLAPAFGLVAAVALPALRTSRSAEIAAVAAHQHAFYVYGVCMLLSSYLLVPAVFGIMHLLPDGRPAWAFLGGGLTQVGLLVAIGDAATELVYWQMGAPGASAAQMAALADRYENAAGASSIYTIGGLVGMVGSAILAAGLIRMAVAPAWAALGLPVSYVVNVVGFSVASQPVLIASYLVMGIAFVKLATLTPAGSPVREARAVPAASH